MRDNRIGQMVAMHTSEIDALTNKHNGAMTEMAQSLCGKLYEVCRGTVRQKPIDLVKKSW